MNNKIFNKKALLIILIFVQISLHLFVLKILNMHKYNWIEFSSIFLALFYCFIAYLVLLLNNKDKKIIYYYCMSTLLVSLFLIIDISILKYLDFSYRYIQIIVLLIILDITLHILTQNISQRLFYKYIVLTLWTSGVLFFFIRREIFLLIYQTTFFFISIYPIIFLIKNIKKIKNYGRHLIPILLIIIILNIVFILLQYVIEAGEYNYDVYIYLNLLELLLSYLILSALGFWKFIKEYRINRNIFILCVFIIGYLYFSEENLIVNFFSIYSFAVILTQYQLLIHHSKLLSNEKNYPPYKSNTTGLFANMVEKNMMDFKKEELYKEQLASFLHDEILQDVIYIKRELRDRYNISEDDNIFKTSNRMINKTRGQINLYKPYINYKISLSENYYNLIRLLKDKFGTDRILVDFVCDDKFFLSSPYDLLIYRILHELITNIYKHSKGNYSVVDLKVENNVIYLNISNYGDYLKDGYMDNMESRGLKIIKREISIFDGTFDMYEAEQSESLKNEGECDNCEIHINIRIPIKGDNTHENFINR